MEEIKKQPNLEPETVVEETAASMFTIDNFISLLVLNWQWFLLSVILCVGIGYSYVRFATPIYQATTKILIKDESSGRMMRSSKSSIQAAENLGIMSNSAGIDNEMEIIASHSIAENVVKRLKLYTMYRAKGRIVKRVLYKTQPITVDIDEASLEKLTSPIKLKIKYEGGKYQVSGKYIIEGNGDKEPQLRELNVTLQMVPTRIRTAVGYLTFMNNDKSTSHMSDGQEMLVNIMPVKMAADYFIPKLSVAQTGKMTSIAKLTFTDESVERAKDYLNQLAISYNDDANEDKNQIAVRTEEFINSRLAKINSELGMTEGQIESFKRQNRVLDVSSTAQAAFSQSNNYDQQLAEMTTQVALLNSIAEYMNEPQNKYQTLPSNVGLTDQAASQLINNYNQIALERNRLLRTANENSPTVIPLTEQLNDLLSSIRRAIAQTRQNYEIKRNAMQSQLSKYSAQVQQSPVQERVLNQIGRQQEVRSGLYLMLLQKREENSISLAATADKGKLIDAPAGIGKIAPRGAYIMGISLVVGLLLPFLICVLLRLGRYRIEGHEDVQRLTKIPIIADVPVASSTAKTKADIVVHENRNNMMEEIFRSLRTNLQFMLKDNQKVILLTSDSSGEGKTFIAANTSVTFALLGKKVVLVGLDIRKPRLSELFCINDQTSGITNVLMHDEPTWDMVKSQILPSGVNDNLDLLMAGPVPPNPAELITRKSLDKTFEYLREHYDYIIVDTAPVGLVTDTLGISRVTDVSIFVCRADYTPKSAIGYFNELASTNKMPNPSIIINAVDLSKKKHGYYYGYGKYGKYAKYGRSYGGYGKYGKYGSYGHYGNYGNYSSSHYSNKDDDSIKR